MNIYGQKPKATFPNQLYAPLNEIQTDRCERLEGRGSDTPEAIAERLRTAEIELDAQQEFKYVVCNDELDRAADELERIVRAELDDG